MIQKMFRAQLISVLVAISAAIVGGVLAWHMIPIELSEIGTIARVLVSLVIAIVSGYTGLILASIYQAQKIFTDNE